MQTGFKTFVKQGVNSLFGVFNYKLEPTNIAYTDYRDFIPFEETIAAAKAANLSVGDYIDAAHNQPGATQDTVDQMAAFGVFDNPIRRICEVGPGSGRFLEKVIKLCNPEHYEIYETAVDWKKWLMQNHNLISQPTDGFSLGATANTSIDLIHIHKVFPGQPTLVTCHYFREIARVVRANGKVVFDIVTENCLDDATLNSWFKSGIGYQNYPSLMAKQYTVDFFQRHGFTFDGSFLVPMKPGFTEYVVFNKQ